MEARAESLTDHSSSAPLVRENQSLKTLIMMPKSFAEYRIEAEQLNQQAQANGQELPIPDVGTLRKKQLARQVLQARLDVTGSCVTQSSEVS